MQPCRTFDPGALVARFGGDEEFARGLLEVALRSSAEAPAELRAACAADDTALLARLAHKIKGTAGDIGADAVRERAREAELAARAGSADAVGRSLELAAAVEDLLVELRQVTATK